MNKTAIKNFAVWARNKLIADITYKAGLLGVTEKGILSPLPQSTRDLQFFDIGTKEYTQVEGAEIKQRNALVKAIQTKEADSDYETAFKSVIEEVAYTWFNRLIAIRFMEVNDYLPSRVRVLSSENPAKNEPDFVTTPFDTDLEFTDAETEEILHMKEQNQLDVLFRKLFIKQCNQLHEILPKLFEETSDYTELLLTISFTDTEGIVYHLTHDIEEKDFDIEQEGQVEIIGWLYQYYNTEPKDETFALLKKNVKITKERIPSATQLFTPDWIVRYMVENSLGRLWVEGHPNDALKAGWKYYLEEAEQEPEVQEQLAQIRSEYKTMKPEDIKVIDPCMGSGHILVYCFDVLMQIYESQGYSERDAAQSVLEYNLYGLDIDDRAAQLAYFAVMMKARQYDRRIFTREITPHIYAIQESNNVNRNQLRYFGIGMNEFEKDTAISELKGLLDTLKDAKEYGSILNVDDYNWDLLRQFVENVDIEGQMSFDSVGLDDTQKILRQLIEIGQTLAQKYDVVVTNPPYMGSSGMDAKLSEFVKKNYPDSKSDLFAVFIERCSQMARKNGYQAMITQHAWMFLSSFEKLRNKLSSIDTVNMAHLGARAFEEIGGEVVQTTSFVLRKSHVADYKGTYCRLIEPTTQQGKENMFLKGENRYIAQQKNFSKIPGSPVAYWVSKNYLKVFGSKKMSEYGASCIGMRTGDNERFLRLWGEVNLNKIGFGFMNAKAAENSGKKWFPYCKGGSFRKWYGNNDYVVNWENDGFEIKENTRRVYPYLGDNLGWKISNEAFYFHEGLTWSGVGAKIFGVRSYPDGMIFDSGANSYFVKDKADYLYFAGLLNCVIMNDVINIVNPTINTGCGVIAQLPAIKSSTYKETIEKLVSQCIALSRTDWDSFETSWDFHSHPMVMLAHKTTYKTNGIPCYRIADSFEWWNIECETRFAQIKSNEEELNRIFIDIYGLKDELTPEVEDKNVTVRKADLQREVRSLISYAVGCMFGRYSLDEPGLILAGQPFSDKFAYASVPVTGTGVCGAPLSAYYVSGDCYLRKEDGTVSRCTFEPDRDNVIPITDEEYFPDDIVGLFCSWLKKVYGADTLEVNLDFIAKALGNKGNTSREVIRNYFLTDFIKDHNKIYQKRPIYWLFDSGKQNGFKALVYMHRWNADTVGNLRVEYLHKTQHIYEREIQRMQEIIDGNDTREKSKAVKRQAKLLKQLQETKDYDAKLAHIALSRIEIDLDDGVKVNYEKVQTGRDGKKMQILAKI